MKRTWPACLALLLPPLLSPQLVAQQQPEPALPLAPAQFTAPAGTVAVDRPNDGDATVWLRGDNYKASIHGDGFTFVPFLGAQAPTNLPIVFHLRSVQVGAAVLDAGCVAVHNTAERVTVQRRGFAEVYDATAQNVKQSFHFATLPQRGELSIALDLATDLRVEPNGADLRFATPHGTVEYRDLLVYDAAGHRTSLPIVLQNGHVLLTVPAEFVANATLPLVVDPIMSNSTIAAVPDQRMQPDVAWNETAQEHLVVYQVPFSANDWDVAAVRCDAFMNPIAPPFWIDYTSQNWVGPRVACKTAEGMFLVVAQVNSNGVSPYSIRGRRYEAIGTQRVLWSQQDIQSPTMPLGLPGDSFSPDVGADPWAVGQAYFTVVWEYHPVGGNGDIVFRQLLPDGTFGPGSVSALNTGSFDDRAPSISKSAGQGIYGIVWTQYGPWGPDGDIVAAEIDYSGFLRVAPFYLDSSTNDDSRPRISTPAEIPGQRTLLVTWQRNYAPFSNSGRLHCAAITTNPAQVLVNRWDLSALLGIAGSTMAFEPSVDSDGLRFAVAHTEVAAALPGTGHSNTYVSTLAVDGINLRVHESRAVLQNSGPQTFGTSVASRYGGGLAESRSYGIVCGSDAISVLGWLYNGHAPGTFWSPRAGGCGGLGITYNGYPVFGHSIDLAVTGTDPFRSILLGFPAPMTPVSVCQSCTIGVTQAVVVPSPYHWVIPYVPALVGVTLSAQGFSIGGTGTCLGTMRFSNAVDFALR
jgi:hypothetical protein